MIISIEAPTYNKRWGGESAAPCAKKIIQAIIFYYKQLNIKEQRINDED